MKGIQREATPQQYTLFKKVQSILPFVSEEIIWERIVGGTDVLDSCGKRRSLCEYQEMYHYAPEGTFIEEQIVNEWEGAAQLELTTRIQRASLNGYSVEECIEFLRSLYFEAPPKGATRRMIVRHIISLLQDSLPR